MPTPVAIAAEVVNKAAPGYFLEPVMHPSTPLRYLLSESLGLLRYFKQLDLLQISTESAMSSHL